MNLKRVNLVISLMLSMFLAAVEGTIVTMATPTITKDLHGFGMISLVFSVYLLTSAISTPVYGKLADLYGRKSMLSIGILIFLTGSLLSGVSQSMAMLIAFRAVQGLGAGAILTVSYTIVGDVFTLEERSKIQGALNMVWGIASVVGPFLGGFIIDALSWHWIFFINLPFGLLAVFLLQSSLKETFEKKKHKIDYAGTVTLSLAVIAFLSIFLFEQTLKIGRGLLIAAAVLITALLLFVFYRIERRAKEPIMPFDIFTKKSVIVNFISFLIYAILMGIDVYMPIYLQNVLGFRPTVSGIVMLPMSIAWFLISLILGRFLIRYGEKAVTLIFGAALLVSAFLLSTLRIDTSIPLVLVYGFVAGIAFGGLSTVLIVMVQDSVEQKRRGSAVGANTLLRTLGQTVGISIFGNIFNTSITAYFVRRGIQGIGPSNLYQSSASPGAVSAEQARLSIGSSVHVLFAIFILIAGLSLLLSVAMPGRKGEDKAESVQGS